jgi:glycosyltransferase involved in cell wall biosynthesis
MDLKPTVSVIIPTYNRAHLIGRAIQSVLKQTYQDFEVIVVDDGSIDNTEEVVKKIQENRVYYYKHDKNKGGSAARNTGISLAKGEYIAFQDSDDEWLPEKLEKQIGVFNNQTKNVGVVYTGFYRIEGNNKTYIPSSKIEKKEGNIHDQLLKGNFITTQAMVVRKECFEITGGFDENLPRFQDWELVIRLSKYYQFKCIDEPLVVSYYTQNSISSNYKAQFEAYELILEKHYQDIVKNGVLLARYLYTIGNLLCQNKDLKPGRPYLLEAIKKQPFNFKYLFAGFLSLFGKNVYSKLAELKRKFLK